MGFALHPRGDSVCFPRAAQLTVCNVRRESIIGQVVADRFKVLSLLGEGGTGQVYLAEHNVLERQFAIKVLRRDLISDQTAAERFRREARAASRMQHRNIVYISDFGSLKDGRLYLVMEYIPGDELATVIGTEGQLPAERAARVLLQVADALDYAHDKGVVHRDLKSENVILTTERHRNDVVKILDFGLAKILYGAGNLDTITFKGQIFGTPEYIPPEQIVGDEVDQRADIYAMGVLAFELITGKTPFTGSLMELLVAHRKLTPPVPSEFAPEVDVPTCFDEIVGRAMQKRPEDRYQRASDIARILRDFLISKKNRGAVLDSDIELMTPAGPITQPGGIQLPSTVTPTPREGPPVQMREPEPSPEALRETLVTQPGPGATTDPGRQEVRKHLRHQLQQLAAALKTRDLAPDSLSDALDQSLRVEEQAFESETELTLLEARLEEIEASGRERESQLRYAIIDLGMERSRLERTKHPPPGHEAMLSDLAYQIGELEVRLLDVARNRETQLDEVDAQIATHRRALEDLRASLVRQDQSLLEHVLALRATAGRLPAVAKAYDQLDELRRLLPG